MQDIQPSKFHPGWPVCTAKVYKCDHFVSDGVPAAWISDEGTSACHRRKCFRRGVAIQPVVPQPNPVTAMGLFCCENCAVNKPKSCHFVCSGVAVGYRRTCTSCGAICVPVRVAALADIEGWTKEGLTCSTKLIQPEQSVEELASLVLRRGGMAVLIEKMRQRAHFSDKIIIEMALELMAKIVLADYHKSDECEFCSVVANLSALCLRFCEDHNHVGLKLCFSCFRDHGENVCKECVRLHENLCASI